ncbi:MAG: HAMP domain-containing histidine kinase [Bacteroidetes bacterium]|nr:HAMP domain-containing histidine kinase [Bacteroidota bacterium]
MKQPRAVIPASEKKIPPHEELLIGTDRIAVDFLQQMHSALKDRDPDDLSLLEKKWLQQVEKLYMGKELFDSRRILKLLEHTYDVLRKKNPWTMEEEAIYSMLEKIVFLKAREESFKKFFDDVEKAIASVIQLDFTAKVPVCDLVLNKHNIFNYAALTLNMIVSKMETSVVSVKAVNTFFSAIPGIAVIVTDSSEKIRFVNSFAEQLLDMEAKDLSGLPIGKILRKHKSVIRQFRKEGSVTDARVKLVSVKNRQRTASLKLTIPKPISDKSEVDEIIYLLRSGDDAQSEYNLNLAREAHDKIAPLNTMAGIADLLKERMKDKESKKLIGFLEKNIHSVKENALNALNSFMGKTISGGSIQNTDVYNLVNEIVDGLRYCDGFNEITIKNNLKKMRRVKSNPVLLRSVFQNLIHNAIKFRKPGRPNLVSVYGKEMGPEGYLFCVKDTGVGIPPKDHEKIFKKGFKSGSSNGFGAGLHLVRQALAEMKGEIDVISNQGTGATFLVFIPLQ